MKKDKRNKPGKKKQPKKGEREWKKHSPIKIIEKVKSEEVKP